MGQITFDQLITKQTCPICGKTVDKVRHWMTCPKYKKPVCMTHCYNDCNQMATITHCSYLDTNKKAHEKNTLPSPTRAK